MRKRLVCLLLAVVMVFSVSACTDLVGKAFFLFLIAIGDDRADKGDIFEFVCEHEEDLLKAVEDGDFSTFENQGPVKDIDADETVVDFSCGGAGMGPETACVGFFYTPDNDMTALGWAPSSVSELVPNGNGFEWWQENGDDYYYVEHICGNFYYYELYF